MLWNVACDMLTIEIGILEESWASSSTTKGYDEALGSLSHYSTAASRLKRLPLPL